VAVIFKKTFLHSYRIYSQYFFKKAGYKKAIIYGEFEIVQDVPSISRQRIKVRLEKLIRKAKKEIVIVSPYFLPGYLLRKLLANAARRGVKVTVIIPRHSDVRSVDLLSNKYHGYYYKNSINVMYYLPANLHAKVVMIDNQVFGLGSPNFDYRSFRYMHEIMLIGRHEGILEEVNQFILKTLEDSIPFDYEAWLRRPRIDKVLGWLLLPFRHLF
jgi:cardiolipin synthase